MDELSESATAPQTVPQRGLLTRGVKAAIALGVAVVLAGGAGGASAYSDHVSRQAAAARHAAAIHLAAARTNLDLAEQSAVQLETALTAIASASSGIADAGSVSALTAAVVVLKNETDKPAFPGSAARSAIDDRTEDLDAAVAAALAAVPPVAESVTTTGAARLAAAGSASAASLAAAKSQLASLAASLARGDDPRGLVIPTINAVKAAQASHDAAVAAAAAAAAAAARASHHSSGSSFSAGPGAPVCASDVLTCVNQIRAYYGLHPLSSNGSLNATAQACADRMAASGQMTHSSYPGGWSTWGENIAEGYGSSVSVFNAWMASPGHRANILRPTFTQMGLGRVAEGNWWCQQFGG